MINDFLWQLSMVGHSASVIQFRQKHEDVGFTSALTYIYTHIYIHNISVYVVD